MESTSSLIDVQTLWEELNREEINTNDKDAVNLMNDDFNEEDGLLFPGNATLQHFIAKMNTADTTYSSQETTSNATSLNFNSNGNLNQIITESISVEEQVKTDEYEELLEVNEDVREYERNDFIQEDLNVDNVSEDRGGVDYEAKDTVGSLTALNNSCRNLTCKGDQQVSSVNRSIFKVPFLEILSSKKKLNPPYLLKKEKDGAKSITTKKDNSIEIFIHMEPSLAVEVSLRYKALSSHLKPVHKCANHRCQMCKPGDHPENSMLCIFGYDKPVEHTVIDEHITYILRNSGKYSIMFTCRNSCESHKRKGKDMVLVARFVENQDIIREQNIKLRCCENVKRDHLEVKSKKRKAEDQGQLPQVKKKTFGRRSSSEEKDYESPASTSSNSTLRNEIILIQVNSEELQMYEMLAKLLKTPVIILNNKNLKNIPTQSD